MKIVCHYTIVNTFKFSLFHKIDSYGTLCGQKVPETYAIIYAFK